MGHQKLRGEENIGHLRKTCASEDHTSLGPVFEEGGQLPAESSPPHLGQMSILSWTASNQSLKSLGLETSNPKTLAKW